MKNLPKYILIAALFTLGACNDDWLETSPLDETTEGNFYRTPEDAFTALVGCYDGLQVVWASGISFPIATAVLSDNAFGGTGNSDGFGYQMLDEFDKLRSPADVNLFGPNWEDYYSAIYRCNVLIGKMEQIDWGGNENTRNTYESEARFLRAFLYFDMVRLWGNIPLLTEPSRENLEQANPDDVYKLIAEDLVFAAENLEGVAHTPASDGRVSKWAAEALLARVYLYYTGYYGKPDLVGMVDKAQALASVEDVIANGGFGLLDDFSHLWPAASVNDYAGEGNKETVFAIKYTFTSDYDGNTDGNHWMVMYGIRGQSIYPYGNGWGGATVTPDLWNAYSEGDTRRSATIISIEEEGLTFENVEDQREYTGLYAKKYSPMSYENGTSVPDSLGATNFMIGQFQDFVSIRYADVLLMAAELGSPNAQTYFDEVRQRAYKESFTPRAVTQENIMKERRLELAFEGLRYWDLLRQGIEHAAETIAASATVSNGGVVEEKTIEAGDIITTKGLQQIPYTQITLSDGVLEQNSGW